MGVIMSDEWNKFVWIMESEDLEFKRAMEAEVSITLILSLDR